MHGIPSYLARTTLIPVLLISGCALDREELGNASCGNTLCEAGENPVVCPADCQPGTEQNGLCDANESTKSHPKECRGGAAADIAVGYLGTCVLMRSGQVACTNKQAKTPTLALVKGLSNITQIDMSDEIACALDKAGALYCWGNNKWGAVGTGKGVPAHQPTRVPVLPEVAQFDIAGRGAAWDHTCAVTRKGDVYCWGRNDHGQSGVSPFHPAHFVLTPTQVKGLPRAAASVAAGAGASCALLQGGEVYCWGSNHSGQLGTEIYIKEGSTQDETATPKKSTLTNVVSMSMAYEGSYGGGCYLDPQGRLHCWGNGRPNAEKLPVLEMIAFSGYQGGGCGITKTGRVLCLLSTSDKPVRVQGVLGAVALAGYSASGCAVLGDGSVRCWELSKPHNVALPN